MMIDDDDDDNDDDEYPLHQGDQEQVHGRGGGLRLHQLHQRQRGADLHAQTQRQDHPRHAATSQVIPYPV